MRRLVSLLLVAVPMAPFGSRAESLALDGDRYWAVLYSRPEAEQAIGMVLNRAEPTRVVKARNGFYAAVAGPVVARPGEGRKVLDALVAAGAPKDVYLTRGADFTDTLWTNPQRHVLADKSYDGEHDAVLRHGDLVVTLSRRKSGEDHVATAHGSWRGQPAFDMAMPDDNPAEKPASQVVFTYFWQGAHCCTVTKIATLHDGAWTTIDAGVLDGGSFGYADLEGKGFSLLLSVDNDFLYAFDSYAGSFAPPVIRQLSGDKLRIVTDEPRFQSYLRESLYGEEESAGPRGGETWHTNGFLAAWVAMSMQVGRGPEAWRVALRDHDRNSMFGPQDCTIDKPLEDCPSDKTVKPPFPVALKAFLQKTGYMKDAAAYPVP